ncbi:BatD family protein [Legionella fairfieldensis]|uniref:BatD family protein n=1 Tax=Legionella fairfieldensis TaxID=45064 RepID=UPI00048D72FE|nr:BatD family protein [Legionella fairfieldensis]
MKRILSVLLICFSSVALAKVSIQLEASQVQLGETFNLTLILDGSNTDAVPDLTPLQNDFTIVGTERSMNYSIVNGQARSVSEWTIFLTAKREGMLVIPSLQIGQEKTVPASIEVTQQAPATTKLPTQQPAAQQQQDVILQAEASTITPYINQQVIYTVKLYNSRRLIDASYQPPAVDDALLVPFGNGRSYQIMQNGRMYAVEEQQYALFPQKSGHLKIKPPIFNALIYDRVPRRISVQAQPTILQVQSVPAQYKGRDWLPAKQVTLSEHYDKSITSLAEGSTLVRTVVLQAVAVPAQLLPVPDFGNSNEFSIYPEKPVESNTFRQQDLVGTITIKVTYLLNKSGKITIPALSVPWFNTMTGREETSTLPELTINVIAGANSASKQNTATDTVSASRSQFDSAPNSQQKKENERNKTRSLPATSENTIAWWVAGGFALAWLLTLVAWFRCRPVNNTSSRKQLLKQLQDACLTNNASRARDVLLKWARMQWPEATVLNLQDLYKLLPESELKHQINELSQALYHNTSNHETWRGEALWRCIVQFKKKSSGKKDRMNPLPPIHRL